MLAVVRQVSDHAAKLAARTMAWQRARDIRDVADTLERLAATVDRCQLSGAERLRAEAKRYAGVAETMEVALRCR